MNKSISAVLFDLLQIAVQEVEVLDESTFDK
jgi:hypothetical protein